MLPSLLTVDRRRANYHYRRVSPHREFLPEEKLAEYSAPVRPNVRHHHDFPNGLLATELRAEAHVAVVVPVQRDSPLFSCFHLEPNQCAYHLVYHLSGFSCHSKP
jgi:hypothetical protein